MTRSGKMCPSNLIESKLLFERMTSEYETVDGYPTAEYEAVYPEGGPFEIEEWPPGTIIRNEG